MFKKKAQKPLAESTDGKEKIKITIEGYDDKPMVLEGVDMFALFSKCGNTLNTTTCGDTVFKGFVAANAQKIFMHEFK